MNPMNPETKLHVELNITDLDNVEKEREALVGSILKLAPQSPLYAKQAMKDAVADLGTTYDALMLAFNAREAHRKEGVILDGNVVAARKANDSSLLLVKTLTEGAAKTLDDLTSMAFKPRLYKLPEPLLAVESIDVRMGKKASGRVTVSACRGLHQQHAVVRVVGRRRLC